MTTPTMPTHLKSNCNDVCRNMCCHQIAKQAPTGRWYITLGHAGFNSDANNADGYTTEQQAIRACASYLNRAESQAKYDAQVEKNRAEVTRTMAEIRARGSR